MADPNVPTLAEQIVMDGKGVTLAQAKVLIAQTGSGTGSAVGGITNPNGGLNAASFGDRAALQGQSTSDWQIPVWRPGKMTKGGSKRIPDATGEDSSAPATRAFSYASMSEADAKTQYGTIMMNKDKMAEWSQLAVRAGLVSASNANDANALGKAWDTAVAWAVNIKAASKGTTEVTPFEAAKLVGETSGGALLAQQEYAASHFTGNKTTSTTTVDQRTGQSGDVLRQLLGRNPTAGEKATYQHGLNQVAAANPVTSTDVSAFKDGKDTGQTTRTITGGYDQRAAEIEQASSASPDVAKNQQATTFYTALVSALGAAV